MGLIDQINADLKTAMLARDEFTTTTLRGLKSAIGYEEVAKGKRDTGLTDAEIEEVVAKEVKKRDDALKIYVAAGDDERADKEDREWKILMEYLPEQLSYEEQTKEIGEIIAENGYEQKDTGKIIAAMKAKHGWAVWGEGIVNILKQEFFKSEEEKQ
ncbi:GatB/YqeY domain-containing protein [Candidatus Saccharibacteria bacterium]|nr:GatB/YqeY domain-containing protein [Candidatus Saccharibacteria bacterium]